MAIEWAIGVTKGKTRINIPPLKDMEEGADLGGYHLTAADI